MILCEGILKKKKKKEKVISVGIKKGKRMAAGCVSALRQSYGLRCEHVGDFQSIVLH